MPCWNWRMALGQEGVVARVGVSGSVGVTWGEMEVEGRTV